MMRKSITRTMATSTIHSVMLTMENDQPKVEKLEPVVVTGKATEETALKTLKSIHGKNAPVSVTKIETSEDVYEISVEDFLKYATKIGTETAQETTEN